MATFKGLVLEHHLKDDGYYNVKIRVTHKRKTVYISTNYNVVRNQLFKNLTLKDITVINNVNGTIAAYQKLINDLGAKGDLYDAKQLSEYLLKRNNPDNSHIDFIKTSRDHIAEIRKTRKRYADNISTTLNSFVDFMGIEKIPISYITSSCMAQYESFLRSDRKAKRPGRSGTSVTYSLKPLEDIGVINYMTNIRTLFNAAVKKYNDDDTDELLIRHYPFKKYVISKPAETKKRNLKPTAIKLIRDLPDNVSLAHGTNRYVLARDLFMLSFYLIGINTVDLFKIDSYKDGRLTYKRSKTKDRRADKALISIRVEHEAIPIIEKYSDKTGKRVFCFYQMYADEQAFNKSINKGLKKIATALSVTQELSFYYARHSWATIARNICHLSKDDIGAALNHSDPNHKVTDTYLEKDWKIVDDANRKVLNTLLPVKYDKDWPEDLATFMPDEEDIEE